MISYRFAPNSSQKGVLFFETPGIFIAQLSRCQEAIHKFSWHKILIFVQALTT